MTKSAVTSRLEPTGRSVKTGSLQTTPAQFPIVGIGCSAGGLEALEAFFSRVTADCDMAFVVIQHLDPRHPSTLAELIARAARLPVKTARNRMKVRPGHIYVIPPNRELSLLRDTLYLLEPAPSTGLRLPVSARRHRRLCALPA